MGDNTSCLTAFQIFYCEHVSGVVAANPSLSSADISRVILNLWKQLPQDKVKEYCLVSNAYAESVHKHGPPAPVRPQKRKRVSRETKKKDPKKPRPALGSFGYFSRHHRAILKEQGGGIMTSQDISKAVNEIWKHTPPAERKAYELQAAEDKERFSQESQIYNEWLETQQKILAEEEPDNDASGSNADVDNDTYNENDDIYIEAEGEDIESTDRESVNIEAQAPIQTHAPPVVVDVVQNGVVQIEGSVDVQDRIDVGASPAMHMHAHGSHCESVQEHESHARSAHDSDVNAALMGLADSAALVQSAHNRNFVEGDVPAQHHMQHPHEVGTYPVNMHHPQYDVIHRTVEGEQAHVRHTQHETERVLQQEADERRFILEHSQKETQPSPYQDEPSRKRSASAVYYDPRYEDPGDRFLPSIHSAALAGSGLQHQPREPSSYPGRIVEQSSMLTLKRPPSGSSWGLKKTPSSAYREAPSMDNIYAVGHGGMPQIIHAEHAHSHRPPPAHEYALAQETTSYIDNSIRTAPYIDAHTSSYSGNAVHLNNSHLGYHQSHAGAEQYRAYSPVDVIAPAYPINPLHQYPSTYNPNVGGYEKKFDNTDAEREPEENRDSDSNYAPS